MAMKRVAFGITLVLPLWAMKMEDAATAANIPSVPKVRNADTEGFPVLPDVDSLLGEVSKDVKGLGRQTSMLLRQLQKDEQASHSKMQQQKVTWEQLLKKQEQENQKVQAENAGRATKMVTLRDGAKETQANIKKAEDANRKSRAKLRALQQKLQRAQQATEAALGASDETKAQGKQTLVPVDEAAAQNGEDVQSIYAASAGVLPDETAVEEEDLSQKPLSFLEVADISAEEEDDYGSDDAATQKKPNTVSHEAAHKLAQSPPKAKDTKGPKTHQAKATAGAVGPAHESAHTRALKSSTDQAANPLPARYSDPDQADNPLQVADAPESLEVAERATTELDADDQTQVLSEGVSVSAGLSEGIVASVSSGLKKVRERTKRSETQLKLSFQTAYNAGKVRHDALIKQSNALEKSLRSMQRQVQKLEATLARTVSTGRKLKLKIHNIGALLGSAMDLSAQ